MLKSDKELQSAAPEKPCLVETGRGFSVSYQNRFLYSKYDPAKNIKAFVNSLEILPGTLFVASSPLLWYGLSELLEKLPENCHILAMEEDTELYKVADSALKDIASSNSAVHKKVTFIAPQAMSFIVNIVSGINVPENCAIPDISLFRRAVLIEFSGGSALNKASYQIAATEAKNTIASFWKNRLTLTKFGRLYSRNLFKNFSDFSLSLSFRNLKKSIERPVFVFGAGESCVQTLKSISADELSKVFILAVDAALPILRSFGIIPDAVVAVEGQLAIEKAYIGSKRIKSLCFADMCSRNSVLRHFESCCFFMSEFTKANFLNRIKDCDFSPEFIPPLGSVGLSATYIALLLRKSEQIPVFLTGLDFSYSEGKTHGQNAPAHVARLSKSTRLSQAENYGASFKEGASKTVYTEETQYYTDIALSGYAKSFQNEFSNTASLFNCTSFGLDLGIPSVSPKQISDFLKDKNFEEFIVPTEVSENTRKGILDFLEAEEKALNRIKELLMFGNDVARCGVSIDAELFQLISEREYLYLHFPDGYRCSVSDLSFLKRVRGEIDFFLKDIKKSISANIQN